MVATPAPHASRCARSVDERLMLELIKPEALGQC
jgi:hypothetical protein